MSKRRIPRNLDHISDYWQKSSLKMSSLRETAQAKPVAGISTQSLFLDSASGGILPGQIAQVYGESGSGKTTLALSICKGVQLQGGEAFYLDCENGLDVDYAERMGVDVDRLGVAQGIKNFEDASNFMLEQCREFSAAFPDKRLVIVWDTMASTPTKAELKAKVGDKSLDDRPTLMRHFLMNLLEACTGTLVTPIILNQPYTKFGQGRFGTMTPKGGTSQTQIARTIFRLSRGKPIQQGQDKNSLVGHRHTVVVEKGQYGPGQSVGVAICNTELGGYGLTDWYILFHELLDSGLLQKRGSWVELDANIYEFLISQGSNFAQPKSKESKPNQFRAGWFHFRDFCLNDAETQRFLFDQYRQMKGASLAAVHL